MRLSHMLICEKDLLFDPTQKNISFYVKNIIFHTCIDHVNSSHKFIFMIWVNVIHTCSEKIIFFHESY